jgi:phage shock protein B
MRILEMIFVLAILAIVFGFPLAAIRARQRGKARDISDESVSQEMTARLTELEERVQVLERIVTDDRADLRRQFKDL